jgi:flagellar basal-body rod modification protein FlgD
VASVNNVDNTSNAAAMAAANAKSNSLMDETQDRFLTLLVTQLQNQDPLNPMDNAQVTTQLAQMATVSGIGQLNNTLLALSGQMDVSQSMQAAALIGKDVLVPGNKVSLGGEAGAKVATPFGVDLISPAAKVTVTIMDGSGKAVRQIELDPQPAAGIVSVEWDGKADGGAEMPDGAYTIKVSASDAEGQEVAVGPLTYGKVASVAYASTGLQLDLGLAGKVSLLDIRKIM